MFVRGISLLHGGWRNSDRSIESPYLVRTKNLQATPILLLSQKIVSKHWFQQFGEQLALHIMARRCNVPQTGTHIEGEQSLKVPDYNLTVREMEQLLPARLPYFHRIAHGFLGDATDAEDTVQDALLTAYKHLNQFRGDSQLSTWITTIVCNCARMQLRRRPRQTYVSLDEPIGEERECPLSEQLAGNHPSPEDDYRCSELRRHLDRAATQLAPSLRRTFHLRDVEGLSIRETAQILGVSGGTVKAQLSRARAQMRRLLSKRRPPKRGSAPPIIF
jgi:RNA polymerase sigma-70 factor, ECF subfamily